MEWRKYPDEKPPDGFCHYLCLLVGFRDKASFKVVAWIYDKYWSLGEETHDRVTHWCPITPPSEDKP